MNENHPGSCSCYCCAVLLVRRRATVEGWSRDYEASVLRRLKQFRRRGLGAYEERLLVERAQ